MERPSEAWLDALVAAAMAEVQRNAVPVINRLIKGAQTRLVPPSVTSMTARASRASEYAHG